MGRDNKILYIDVVLQMHIHLFIVIWRDLSLRTHNSDRGVCLGLRSLSISVATCRVAARTSPVVVIFLVERVDSANMTRQVLFWERICSGQRRVTREALMTSPSRSSQPNRA